MYIYLYIYIYICIYVHVVFIDKDNMSKRLKWKFSLYSMIIK